MKKNKHDEGKKVRFEFFAGTEAKVYLAGSFNNWTPLELNGSSRNGKYSKTIELPKGRHEYKFIVNDDWLSDPNNPQIAINPFGSSNSTIEV
jgi:1,4-alpha-glucan branching enzyme